MNAGTSAEEDLFDAARQLDGPAAQAKFLTEACGGDPAMQARLTALLRVDREAEAFFTQSLTAIPPLLQEATLDGGSDLTSFAEEKIGTRIGRYEIVERIGEGGCGSVYMAEQREPVRRQVALKVIKLGMDTLSVISRFEAERQALAMMDHPNIAMVLDAGATEAGRPYFVMEMVRGLRITEYCDFHLLGIPERLNLFTLVCQAIQHAHQKGVVHRDIKPSNILVTSHDGVAVPKVIDFGIAKATETRLTEETILTGNWQILGTPAYMSPEQAEKTGGSDIDTRSDIYSLGALLLELLTGRPPFDPHALAKLGLTEMLRTLREVDPPPASTMLENLGTAESAAIAKARGLGTSALIGAVRGDLDNIVMKALQKDRSRRYETAHGLAMDIHRHLHNEPVLARTPTRRYRMGKLIRRNRVLLGSIGAVAVTLFVATLISTRLYFGEREARKNLALSEQQQALLRKEAETGREQEMRLRLLAETREKITQALVLLRSQNMEAADAIVDGLPVIRPTPEGAQVFRSLGDWHAVNRRWRKAAERFSYLVKVNQFDEADNPTLDHLRTGSAWIESGDLEAFDGFRRTMVARFETTPGVISAERIVKVSLLVPAGKDLMARLDPLIEEALASLEGLDQGEISYSDMHMNVWRMNSLALAEYRRGQHAAAAGWARRCLEQPSRNGSRDASAGLLLAMSLKREGKLDESLAALDSARQKIEKRSATGLNLNYEDDGYWFDWVIARILLREAEESIGTP